MKRSPRLSIALALFSFALTFQTALSSTYVWAEASSNDSSDDSSDDSRAYRFSPFGDKPILGFGNLPQSPNPILFGPMLHFSAVDLYQDEGTPVYSVIEGRVSIDTLGHPDWTTTVIVMSANGLMTYFMHLDQSSVPEQVRKAAEANGSIPAGTLLGRLVHSPEKTSLHPHLHFGVADCKKKLRLNPMNYLDYVDTTPPVIRAIQAEPKDDGIEVTVSAYDKVDAGEDVLPLHRLDYRVLPDQEWTTLFDATSMPAQARESDQSCANLRAYDGYNPEIATALYRNDDDWGGYDYAITLDASLHAKLATPFLHQLDRSRFAKGLAGTYEIEVRAYDARGNQVTSRAKF